MSDLVFGQTPPGHVTTSNPHTRSSCARPHYDKEGDPKWVPGIVYRWAGGSQVLCIAHGKQLIERVQAEASA